MWANFPVKRFPMRWKNILLIFLAKHLPFLDMKYSRVPHPKFSTSWTFNFISSPVKLFHFVDMKCSRVPQLKFSNSWSSLSKFFHFVNMQYLRTLQFNFSAWSFLIKVFPIRGHDILFYLVIYIFYLMDMKFVKVF